MFVLMSEGYAMNLSWNLGRRMVCEIHSLFMVMVGIELLNNEYLLPINIVTAVNSFRERGRKC